MKLSEFDQKIIEALIRFRAALIAGFRLVSFGRPKLEGGSASMVQANSQDLIQPGPPAKPARLVSFGGPKLEGGSASMVQANSQDLVLTKWPGASRAISHSSFLDSEHLAVFACPRPELFRMNN